MYCRKDIIFLPTCVTKVVCILHSVAGVIDFAQTVTYIHMLLCRCMAKVFTGNLNGVFKIAFSRKSVIYEIKRIGNESLCISIHVKQTI